MNWKQIDEKKMTGGNLFNSRLGRGMPSEWPDYKEEGYACIRPTFKVVYRK
jgi:hypothetical protein